MERVFSAPCSGSGTLPLGDSISCLMATARSVIFLGVFVWMEGLCAAQAQPASAESTTIGRLVVVPAFVVSVGHDTNVYREPTGFSDYETYVVPQFTASLQSGRGASQLWGALEVVHFNENPGAKNFQIGTRFDWRGARVRPYGRANLRQTAANPGVTEVSEIGRRSTRIERSLTSGLELKLGTGLVVAGHVENVHTDWAADAVYRGSSLREKLNRDDNVVAGSVDLFLTPISAVRVSGSAMRSRFEFSPERDANSLELAAGLLFRAPAAIVGSLRAGVRDVRPLVNERARFRGPVWEGGLLHQFQGGGFVFANLARSVQYTAEQHAEYVVAQTMGVRVAKPLVTRWIIGAWWVRDSLEYPPEARTVAVASARSNLVAVSAGYKLSAPLTVGATFERQTYRGHETWNASRVVGFLTFGRNPLQRLDRPLPFER